MDFTAYGPLVGELLKVGAPMISTALQMGIGEIPVVGGVVGPLVGLTAPSIVSMIAAKLGAPADATPQQVADKIAADPDAARQALASLEEQHRFELARQKQADDADLAKSEELDRTALSGDAMQAELDRQAAASSNFFVYGPRPAVMWGLGAVTLLYAMAPLFRWVLRGLTGRDWGDPPELPWYVWLGLFALLGIVSALRSYDKKSGTASLPPGAPAAVKATVVKPQRVRR